MEQRKFFCFYAQFGFKSKQRGIKLLYLVIWGYNFTSTFFKYNECIEYLVEDMKKKKKKKTIAKRHGIGTFSQYVQNKKCWEKLYPKTVAALGDDKLFVYVLKRPVYPVGPIVT